MHYHDLLTIEVDDQYRITRALDLGSAHPIEVPGGDVIFVDELARTNGTLQPVGDRPIATTSVYDQEQLTTTLRRHYDPEYVEFALSTPLGESALDAACIAESRTHNHPTQIESVASEQGTAMTDGGENTVEHTPRIESVCFDCGASYPTSGSCDCGGIEEL